MAYAGLDIGTSGCKMVVYNAAGDILSSARRTYKEDGHSGHRELDAAMVWNYVRETIKEAASNSPGRINCLAVASLGESVVCLDEHNKVLAPSMLTGDKRGIEECRYLKSRLSRKKVMKITGLPLNEMYSLPKFVWTNQNTDIFKRSRYIFFYEDYIGYLLTGKRKISYSSAARSMAFDIGQGRWSHKLLAMAGLDPSFFSLPVPSGTVLGTVLPKTAAQLGLSDNTLVVAGGHDQGCAGLGSGMISPSQGEDGQGTCEVMQFILPRKRTSSYMIKNGIPCAPYVLPGVFLAQIELTTCGILMNWSRDTLFTQIKQDCIKSEKNFFAYMDSLAEKNPPGSLYVLPSFGSSGNPDVCYDALGSILGMTIHTRPQELYQAIKEGMAYQMYTAYESLHRLDIRPQTIRVTGGGSVSDYTLQLRTNVFNTPMEVLENAEAGTLGCAILSAKAVHPHRTIQELVRNMVHVKRRFNPQPEKQKAHEAHYLQYKYLYNILTNFSNKSMIKT